MHAFGSSCLLPWSSVEKLEYMVRRAACLRQKKRKKGISIIPFEMEQLCRLGKNMVFKGGLMGI